MSRPEKEIISEIKRLLEEYVAPSVAQHGGTVNFDSYKDGVVILEMSGACSGCAGSTMTLKFGVEQMLVQMIPEVVAVEAFDDPSSNIAPYFMESPWIEDSIDSYFMDTDIDIDSK